MQEICFGDVVFSPVVKFDDTLATLGGIRIHGKPIRCDTHCFLPWFDTFDGTIFDTFRVSHITESPAAPILHLIAVGRQDYPFQERRDMSGDLCIRTASWDAAPYEAKVDLHLRPVHVQRNGHAFSGFSYQPVIRSPMPIHRYLDRQTWEPGGHLSDHQICCRNWVRPPRCPIGIKDEFSTAGLDLSANTLQKANPMPGNLWARWSLLPGFDMLYGKDGCLLTWFDQVSLIRTCIETLRGENCLRVADLHLFEAHKEVTIPAKTVVWSDCVLDDTAAINLWTEMTDRDYTMARKQFNMPLEKPPVLECGHTNWINMNFDTTYEESLANAAALGMEALYIDPVWEHAEAYNMELRDKLGAEPAPESLLARRARQSMCCTTDFNVAEIIGGEAGLKRLCERANQMGIQIFSWMATHLNPASHMRESPPQGLARGTCGIFAARESGYHPDTGYPADCWPIDLNGPMMEYTRDRILGVCQRTGLAGFLWDSFSNLGWWQIDYATSTMRPQFDRMAELYRSLEAAGLYLMPEGIAAFSHHNCLGLLHAECMEGDMAAFYYNSATPLPHGAEQAPALDIAILRGQQPIDKLFRLFAHKWIPNSQLQYVPQSEWDPDGLAALQRLFNIYKNMREDMQLRTVLQDEMGVEWQNAEGQTHRWVFRAHPAIGRAIDAYTKETVRILQPNHVYWVHEGISAKE